MAKPKIDPELKRKRKEYEAWYLTHTAWIHGDAKRRLEVKALAARQSSMAQHPSQWSLDKRPSRRTFIRALAEKHPADD